MIIDIERYGSFGEGVSKNQGKVIFVDGALVGERVEVQIIKQQSRYDFAKVKKILSKSDKRVQPICPYFNSCGGCQLMHANYHEQLKIKEQIVNGNIAKYAKTMIDSDIQKSVKQLNYRNHMTFSVKNNSLCLHKKSSNELENISYCHIANEMINSCIEPINNFMRNQQMDFDKVDIKAIQKQILITFYTKSAKKFDSNLLLSDLSNMYSYGIFVYNTKDKHLKHAYGIKNISYENSGLKCIVRPQSFLQVNDDVAKILYDDVLGLIKDDIVVDCYSGRGELSCRLAQKAKFVFGIEIDKSSHLDAVQIAQINEMRNIKFILGDVDEEITKLKDVDCVVIDPPRGGMKARAANNIKALRPNKIIYISCASNTLARDLNIFMNNYSIKYIKPYDMFPQTNNIETLVLLEKINEKD